jgi:hypothetical protein
VPSERGGRTPAPYRPGLGAAVDGVVGDRASLFAQNHLIKSGIQRLRSKRDRGEGRTGGDGHLRSARPVEKLPPLPNDAGDVTSLKVPNSKRKKVLRQPPFRPFHLRQRLMRHGRNATLLGATLATCLNAGMASAIDFTFTFSGEGVPTSPTTVTGLISGLLDNTNDQKTGFTATITSSTHTPSGGWPVFTWISDGASPGTGIDVSGGIVTYADLKLGMPGTDSQLDLRTSNTSRLVNFRLSLDHKSSIAPLVFTPLSNPSPTAVPGPLPLFGAAAALGWSRRLRRRCRTIS